MAIQITKPATAKEGFHGVLYGKPKVGKTSTADDPKFKVLLIDMEGGTAVLEGAKNVDRVAITNFEDFVEITQAVRAGQLGGQKLEYDLYILDSISRLQEITKEYVALKYAPNRKREISGKFGAQSDWGDLRDLIIRVTKEWHQLTKRGDSSIHALWIAHEAVTKDDLTEQVTSTKIQLQGKDTADVIMAHVDGIFYMYNKTNEDGSLVRGILTRPAGIYQAGVRQSKHKQPLPATIENPIWSEIFTTLGYVRK